MPGEDGFQIHYRDAIDVLQRDDFQVAQQRIGLRGSLRLDGADHYILAALVAPPPFVQHAKRLSHPRRIAQEHFQLASALVDFFRLGLLQEFFGSAFAGNGCWHWCTLLLLNERVACFWFLVSGFWFAKLSDRAVYRMAHTRNGVVLLVVRFIYGAGYSIF